MFRVFLQTTCGYRNLWDCNMSENCNMTQSAMMVQVAGDGAIGGSWHTVQVMSQFASHIAICESCRNLRVMALCESCRNLRECSVSYASNIFQMIPTLLLSHIESYSVSTLLHMYTVLLRLKGSDALRQHINKTCKLTKNHLTHGQIIGNSVQAGT